VRLLKNIRVLAGVAIVAGILAVALWPSAIQVDVAVVSRGPMQVTIDEFSPGTLSRIEVVDPPYFAP